MLIIASDAVIEYILTTPYDISTATVNNTKIVHRGGGKYIIVPTQVVFNNDGTKMFIVNHKTLMNTVDYWSLSTAFDISTATFDDANILLLVKKKEQIQLHLIMMVPECLLLV